jgi:protein SCO1/2
MKLLRNAVFAVVAIGLVLIVALFAYQYLNRGTDRSLTADSELGAPFNLIDHNGNPITEAAFAGKPTLVYFGFTRCPEVCPTTFYEMAGWFDTLGEKGKDLQAFFITVDPERDTPEIMKGFAEAFTDRATGITGDPKKSATCWPPGISITRKFPTGTTTTRWTTPRRSSSSTATAISRARSPMAKTPRRPSPSWNG